MQQFLFVGLLGEYRVSANNAVYVEETGGCSDVQSPAGKTQALTKTTRDESKTYT